MPCRHVLCLDCISRCESCPYCRSQFHNHVRINITGEDVYVPKDQNVNQDVTTDVTDATMDVDLSKLQRYHPSIVEKCMQLIVLIRAIRDDNPSDFSHLTMQSFVEEFYMNCYVVDELTLSLSDASKIVEYHGFRRAIILYDYVNDHIGEFDGPLHSTLILAHEILRNCIYECLGVNKSYLGDKLSVFIVNSDDDDRAIIKTYTQCKYKEHKFRILVQPMHRSYAVGAI